MTFFGETIFGQHASACCFSVLDLENSPFFQTGEKMPGGNHRFAWEKIFTGNTKINISREVHLRFLDFDEALPIFKPHKKTKTPSDFWSSWNLCMMFCSSCSALSMARLQNTASRRRRVTWHRQRSGVVSYGGFPAVTMGFNMKMAQWLRWRRWWWWWWWWSSGIGF